MDVGRISSEDIRRDLDMAESVDDVEYYMAPSVHVGFLIRQNFCVWRGIEPPTYGFKFRLLARF